MSYAPNYNDPRVLSRVKRSLGFALACFSPEKEQEWSTRYIDKYFGQNQNDLSKYLRSILLIETNSRWNKDTGECKKYILNTSGVELLKDLLQNNNTTTSNTTSNTTIRSTSSTTSITSNNSAGSMGSSAASSELHPIVLQVQTPEFETKTVHEFIIDQYHDDLVTGNFTYKQKTFRLWHGFQSVKSEYRKPILASYGYQYEYDIIACAPTLLLQYSRQLGNDLPMPRIQEYLKDRSLVRARLAKEAELNVKDVKILINALFCGAKLGNNKAFSLSHLLNHDESKITFLKQEQFLSELIEEIRIMWSYIYSIIPRVKQPDKNGKLRLKIITSSERWNIYFRLEGTVLASIRKYINNNGLKCFLEHDGWSCKNNINLEELVRYIKNDTKFDVQLEMKINE